MALDERITELIHREIDGVNTQEESSQLRGYLSENQEAKSLYDDLRRISTLLEGVEVVEPPRNLRANILNSINFTKYAAASRRSPLNWLTTLLPQKAPMRYALVFSLGLFAGVVVYALVADVTRDASVDISKLYGTMMADRSVEKLAVDDEIEIALERVTGTITAMHTEDLVLVQVSLRSQEDIETVFEFDSGFLTFAGYRQLDDAKNSLHIAASSLHVTSPGSKKYLLLFDDKARVATSLNVRILSSGALLYERPLSSRKKSE